jgi:hypothetical protein
MDILMKKFLKAYHFLKFKPYDLYVEKHLSSKS